MRWLDVLSEILTYVLCVARVAAIESAAEGFVI